ncbi:septal ring lytic transglycosylase RlpA family protein [Thalassotalea sp. 1_MG-2023]|uniref:septal ring lytic transglycosylase RlpA family protein n=1 Tax=Thalassotalea sp. 1_MG-2023 TaxID=3062680 RepID=UPI0026E45F46|nr:septal ring lytic transglycosylase RlpA family protein [Thalassotalea sp. 1_MG-2023]MDO6426571.1 septal ring lytic transglycosylase RlpA family protein [Thalassotalea sp. 1_MG-2023]
MTYTNFLFIIVFIVLMGCSAQQGRYKQQHDSSPTRKPSAVELQDAIPRVEKKSRGGNRNYTVRGIQYEVLDNASNFKQQGEASWYGKKFHGHLTSNGEIYNMYGMSAAHKNLPLPTYVRVTNLANNKSVIVRVNDRGPFHEDRVIDLSYSAAYKLDMLKTGTAQVTVEAISNINQEATVVNKEKTHYIQVFATKNSTQANKTANKISTLFNYPTKAKQENGYYKVHIGPIKEKTVISMLLEQLKTQGYPSAFTVKY